MQGLSVPFRIGPTGGVQVVSNTAELIGQRVLDFIVTNHRERLMLPEYGANLATIVFDLTDSLVVHDTINGITPRLAAAVPEIQIVGITALPDAIQPSQLNIEVSYTIKPFTDVRSVVTKLDGVVTQETGF